MGRPPSADASDIGPATDSGAYKRAFSDFGLSSKRTKHGNEKLVDELLKWMGKAAPIAVCETCHHEHIGINSLLRAADRQRSHP